MLAQYVDGRNHAEHTGLPWPSPGWLWNAASAMTSV